MSNQTITGEVSMCVCMLCYGNPEYYIETTISDTTQTTKEKH